MRIALIPKLRTEFYGKIGSRLMRWLHMRTVNQNLTVQQEIL